jgi:20S proteasome subunit beta 2
LKEFLGFKFDFNRNESLLLAGFKPPEPLKTGTTIAGVIFKDGVVLGADTKTSRGQQIDSDQYCKIYRIEDNI